ncbi:MAG TPA: TldD/PmbA family protein [Coriobacteriia bacterium]|nr:TldD/PmbA family protein [Coriobacteriia bacterium]
MLTSDQARELARRAVALTHADEAEALVAAETSALTRFANNRINQNVAEENALVSVRAVLGKQIGVASTNRTDDASLKACCEAAVAAARVAPADPKFPGLPEPEAVRPSERGVDATREYGADARADAVDRIVAGSRSRSLTAAGKVRAAEHTLAVANSRGIDAGGTVTGLQATVLSAGQTGSGWASFLSRDASEFDPEALGLEAAELAIRSANPTDLEPGVYPVVLAPEAVADIMDFLAYVGFSVKAVEEGRSFMTNKLEYQVFSQEVTIVDDALAAHAIGLTFDYEGVPKRPVTLVEAGVPLQPVIDSYWAARTGWQNTGHALPAPNQFGPMPLNLEMLPGDSTLDELIGRVDRGVYVTRFHYVNVEDPVPVTLTGMTRDGTFLIEDGKLTRPLKNLRFTQSAVDALAECDGVTAERRFVGTEEGASLVPGILCARFAFTGQTA